MFLPRDVDPFGWHRDTLLSEENTHATRVRGEIAVIEFHGTSNSVAISAAEHGQKPLSKGVSNR
jgi:hypothetical protein